MAEPAASPSKPASPAESSRAPATPSGARVWIAATRPRTLPAAAAPVLMGTAIAMRDGALHVPSALAAFTAAIFIQIGTNFANDYFDYVNGADTEARLGPTRATQAGLVSPAAMRRAFVGAFAIAFAIGVALIVRGGWPIALIGLSAIAAGILYTGGPRPLGYLGLGDALVLAFFGPIAVAATYGVQAQSLSTVAIVAGLGPGCLSTALLAVNNLRDVDTDRAAGKGTLAVRLGPRFAKTEILAMIAIAAAVPIVLAASGAAPPAAALTAGTMIGAVPIVGRVVRARPGDRLLDTLAATGRLLVLYSVAFAVTWIA